MKYKISDFHSLLAWVKQNPEEAALQIQQLTGRVISFEEVISEIKNLYPEGVEW